jgi:hypothetical protein
MNREDDTSTSFNKKYKNKTLSGCTLMLIIVCNAVDGLITLGAEAS